MPALGSRCLLASPAIAAAPRAIQPCTEAAHPISLSLSCLVACLRVCVYASTQSSRFAKRPWLAAHQGGSVDLSSIPARDRNRLLIRYPAHNPLLSLLRLSPLWILVRGRCLLPPRLRPCPCFLGTSRIINTICLFVQSVTVLPAPLQVIWDDADGTTYGTMVTASLAPPAVDCQQFVRKVSAVIPLVAVLAPSSHPAISVSPPSRVSAAAILVPKRPKRDMEARSSCLISSRLGPPLLNLDGGRPRPVGQSPKTRTLSHEVSLVDNLSNARSKAAFSRTTGAPPKALLP